MLSANRVKSIFIICLISELRMLFFSSVNLQQKLGEGIVEPRSLEDEGIFVGRKPIVPTNVINRAEKRILQECQDEKKVKTLQSNGIQP